MMKIARINLWYSVKKDQPNKMIQIIPESQSIPEIKKQIAAHLRKIKKMRYYFVVMGVRRPDRTIGYRTVIPKANAGE